MSKPQIVLQKDVFDALELSALIHGGIGRSCLSKDVLLDEGTDEEGYGSAPSCIIGHGLFLDGLGFSENNYKAGKTPVLDELARAFPAMAEAIEEEKVSLANERDLAGDKALGTICYIELLNDDMVAAYSKNLDNTLTWKQWCRRLGVVRGGN